MHSIRKICVLVSLFWISLAPLYPQTQKYGFSLSPILGMLYGQGEELLYNRPGAQSEYASQLLWDLKPLFYAGLAWDAGPRDPFAAHGFVAAGSIKFGFPGRSGDIEDRDWLNDDNGFLTNYSHHKAYTISAAMADISAGFSWALTDFLALSAFAEFSYMRFFWAAEDGYLQYPKNSRGDYVYSEPWNGDLEKDPINGVGIQYRQSWFIAAPGVSLKGKLARSLSLEGSASYSPLIYVAARDDHLYPNLFPGTYNGMVFWDFLSFGHYFKGGARFILTPPENKNLDISLAFFYRLVSGTRGNSYSERTGKDAGGGPARNIYDGGAGHSSMDVSLTARIRIAGRY